MFSRKLNLFLYSMLAVLINKVKYFSEERRSSPYAITDLLKTEDFMFQECINDYTTKAGKMFLFLV